MTRLRALAGERRRFGYRRLHILLAREGMALNYKRLFRFGGGPTNPTGEPLCRVRRLPSREARHPMLDSAGRHETL